MADVKDRDGFFRHRIEDLEGVPTERHDTHIGASWNPLPDFGHYGYASDGGAEISLKGKRNAWAEDSSAPRADSRQVSNRARSELNFHSPRNFAKAASMASLLAI
jgi:hypothetical protein